jgi:hypothetical protein
MRRVGGPEPKRKRGRLGRGPLTGIDEPVYEPGEWQGHHVGRVMEAARYGDGSTRRAGRALVVFMALPFVVIVLAAVIGAIR